MLTPHLQNRLDEKWNNCWPVSDLRPLALLDLISYLFFIKKLDDWELIHQKVKNAHLENFTYTKEIEEFTWSKLQSLNAREIQHLFTKEHGVIDLMNNYAHLKALFSDFFKGPLLIDPTPKLIFNSIEIINLIETSDKISQGSIIDYLFSKSKVTAQNGHEFLPEYISKLMVSIAEPRDNDTVVDPAAGNGSLLINSYKYISDNHNTATPSFSSSFTEARVSGIESDLTQLRLAAMNMVLHGIKNPKIRLTPPEKVNINPNPSVIISSLLFSTPDPHGRQGKLEKENVVMTEVTENLAKGGRAVILVPQSFLKSDNPAVIKTRKSIVEKFSLEAVITLAPKTGSLFSNGALLIFNHSITPTEHTWFCRWGPQKKRTRNEALANSAGDDPEDFESSQALDILHKWKIRNDKEREPSGNSFFIDVRYIKTNNYNLSFNDYKLIRQQGPLNAAEATEETETILPAKKENLHEFFETSAPLPQSTTRRRLTPVLLIVLLLLLGAGAYYYWFYLRDNHHQLYTRSKITDTGNNFKISNAPQEPDDDTTSTSPQPTADTQPDSTAETAQVTMTENNPATKYTVVSKAWFHYQPDSGERKAVFLRPRKDLVLTPKEEKNGFVYVVYTNSKGGTTHGWLDKKDLEAVE